MMTPATLLSLACAIANKIPVDASAIEAQLSESEKIQVEQLIEKGACLPDNMEKLLEKIKKEDLERMGLGKGQDKSGPNHQPCEGCF